MADSSPQIAVADWINREWLPHTLGEAFYRTKISLVTGGEHSFASVNADRSAVGTICTSASVTARGKTAVGKVTKVRADLYFLLMAKAVRRFVVFTDPGMYALFREERRKRLVPEEIGFMLATDVPEGLMARLKAAQRSAADEVSPATVAELGI